MLLRHFKCGGSNRADCATETGWVAPSILGHGTSLLRMENEIR